MSDHGHAPATTDAAHDTHAVPHDAHHIAGHIKFYWATGGVLFVFTVITVALSYMDFDKWFGTHGMNMIIGMLVATFKVTLVAAIFMHLKGERPTIWRFLYFTAFFVLGLILLTALHYGDPIFGTSHSIR